MLRLHDHLNPNQAVLVSEAQIQAIETFGSGSAIMLENGTVVAVHETVIEIEHMLS